MSALTSLLVRDEVVSVQQIEDALQRQVLEGGEIDTALLELNAVSENTLNAYRAASFGLLPASRADLMDVERSLVELLPHALVQRHRVVPIGHHGHSLVVACAHPLDPMAARELEAHAYVPIEPRIATEVRVEAALALHYAIDIAPRMRRLAEQVATLPAGDAPVVEISELEARSSLRPPAAAARDTLDDGDDADFSDVYADEPRGAVPLPPPTIVTEHGAGPRAQPQDRPVAVGRVVEVQSAPGRSSAVSGVSRSEPVRAHQGQGRSQSGAHDEDDATEPSIIPPSRVPPASGAGSYESQPSALAGSYESQPSALAAPRLPREAGFSSLREGDSAGHGSSRPRPRRTSMVPKGPLTKTSARELLEAAEERDEVVDVFFNYARQYFESTVLFAVREDRALGLESHNTPGVVDVHELSILFERGGTLEDLTRSLSPRVVDLSRKDADHALALALDRMQCQPCALIPVCIRQRVVSLVYGDRSGDPFRMDDMADLVELLPTVSQAFERIIRARKMFAMQARLSPLPPPPPSQSSAYHSSAAPRASWSAPSGAARMPKKTPPPGSIAGVFPVRADGLGPHEVPTPQERKRNSEPAPAPSTTLSGLAASTAKRRLTARDVPGIGSAPPPPPPPSRSTDAKRALTSLGVPRTAPPPPPSNKAGSVTDFAGVAFAGGTRGEESREELERNPTVRLPAQSPLPALGNVHGAGYASPSDTRGAGYASPSARYSKPPPGAGSYRSAVNSDRPPASDEDTSPSMPALGGVAEPVLDTRPIRNSRPSFQTPRREDEPDTDESPASGRIYASRPPARSAKLPPGGGGLYKAHDMPSERVSLRPSRAPAPAEPSSNPPSTYSSHDVRADVVSLPAPPRMPSSGAADGGQSTPPTRHSLRPRHSAAAITQPLSPKRTSRQAMDPQEQHEQDAQHGQQRERQSAADTRREGERDATPADDVVRMSSKLHASLRPPAVAPTRDEPSIVVDGAAQLTQLVADLCHCGPDDEAHTVESLLRYGDDALPVVVEHFPGPLWFDRRKPHPRLPMGRDVSAIARALSAFGERAWPHLATLLTSWDPETRFYATLLVSDQVLPPLLNALSQRLFDTDPQIRLIVKDTLPQYRSLPGFNDIARLLRERAADARANMQDRLAALDAIAALRDVGSVPLLIRSNEDADRQISLPAHRALVTITGQDFGNATRKWNAWYDENKGLHRVEWLIESLMHTEQALRATAGIELQKLTQVYYGFVAAAPKRERERAQKRYTDWWQTQGKAKLA